MEITQELVREVSESTEDFLEKYHQGIPPSAWRKMSDEEKNKVINSKEEYLKKVKEVNPNALCVRGL